MGNDREANVIADERLISGEIMSRMKDRPLPPPPRPKRENKRFSKKSNFDDDELKFDKDDDAEKIQHELDFEQQQTQEDADDEKIINETENIENVIESSVAPLRIETSFDDVEHEMVGSFEDDQIRDAKTRHDDFLSRQESDDFSESEPRVIEVEVSTQTDPVPYEELIDEDEEDLEAFLSADGKIKTLEDILKEEQEAEMERARWSRQLKEAQNLSRGIERFRESNQRSFSEKSKTSGARSRSTSRPITPSAVVVEHRKSSPIIADNVQQTLTEAGLFVHPITYDDFGIKLDDEEEIRPVEEVEQPIELVEESRGNDITDVNNNNFEEERVDRQIESLDEVDNIIELDKISIDNLDREIEETFERISSEAFGKQEVTDEREQQFEHVEGAAEVDEEFDAEMQRKIEEMIESVMNSAREEVDWIREREKNDELQKEAEKLKSCQVEETTSDETEMKIELQPDTVENLEEKNEIAKEILPQPVSEEEAVVETEIAELLNEEKSVLIEKEPIKAFEEFQPLEEFKPISPPTLSTAESHDDIEVEEFVVQIPTVSNVMVEQDKCIHQLAEVKPDSPPPPQAPPRKKSTVTASVEDFINKMETCESQELPKVDECQHDEEPELRNITRIEITNTDQPRIPSRLHIDTLEIDNLSVTSIQAGRISASEIDTHSITASEFESKSANLPISIPAPIVQIPQQPPPTFTFPSSLIEEIVERVVRNTSQVRLEQQQQLQQQQGVNQQVQTETQTEPSERPTLPQEYTTIPQSFYQLQDPSDSEIVQKSPQQRRRRHQRSISTSEEEYQREQRHKSRGKDSSSSVPSSSQQPSIASLGGQFLSACGSALRDQGSQLMEILRASSKDENKRDLHVAILILVIIVAGLFLMGFDDKSVHHHWNFINPPDHEPR